MWISIAFYFVGAVSMILAVRKRGARSLVAWTAGIFTFSLLTAMTIIQSALQAGIDLSPWYKAIMIGSFLVAIAIGAVAAYVTKHPIVSIAFVLASFGITTCILSMVMRTEILAFTRGLNDWYFG